MTADEIADLAVVELNAIPAPLIQFVAKNPDTVAEAEKERADFAVFVLAYSESDTPTDRGFTCRRERVVSVVVNGPLKETIDRRKAQKFSEQIRSALEGTELGGFLWTGNETVSIFDAEALRNKNQFLSLARATYYAIS